MQGAITPLRGLAAAALVIISALGAAQDHPLRLIQESYIKGVQPGKYILKVSHESGQVKSKSIVVTDQNKVLEVRTARH